MLIKEANDRLATARKEYLEYLNSLSGTQAENTIASTEYSEVLQAYQSIRVNRWNNEINNKKRI